MAEKKKFPNPQFFRARNNMDLKKQAENLKEVGAIALDLIKETDWKAFAAKQKDHLLDNVARVAREAKTIAAMSGAERMDLLKNGEKHLGTLYRKGDMATVRREWKGVESTLIDFTGWLKIWGMLLGFRLAGRKPDTDHPFGHGRIEYISGLAVAGLILLMGVELAKSSFEKILHPEEVAFSALALGILAASVCVKLYMWLYNRSIGRRIKSAAMEATAMDSLSITAATAAVLLAMLIGKWTGLAADGYVGLVVALFILFSAYKAAKETLSPLLGQTPDPELVREIRDIVMAHGTVQGVHDLVVHDYGPGRCMISLHAEVPAHGDILEMHDIIDNIEKELAEKLHCQAVIHMDPIVTDDALVGALRQQVAEAVKQVDPGMTIHDFRLVRGTTHTNLIFDAVLPFSSGKTTEQAAQEIRRLVKALDSTYFAVVTVEHSYTA